MFYETSLNFHWTEGGTESITTTYAEEK